MQKKILWKRCGILIAALLVHVAMWAAGNNLALHRAAYHSSALNFDNIAHLVTDGIKTTYEMPEITCQYDDSPAGETKEMAFDGNVGTKFLTFHRTCWIQYAFSGGQAFAINKYTVASANDDSNRDPKNWTLQASNGGEWTNLDTQTNVTFSERKQTKTFVISNTTPYKMYRLNITANQGDSRLQFSEFGLYEGETGRIEKHQLSSQWISETAGNQWIYIDLGTQCRIETVKLFWNKNYAKSYNIELSDDARTWQKVYSTTAGKGGTEEMQASGNARYVRLKLTEANNDQNYQLIEMEVYGSGAVQKPPKPQPAPLPDGTQYLTGGNWKLQRAEQVSGEGGSVSGIELSQGTFDDSNWLIATVPGTVLTSYFNEGAVPDLRISDNILQISDKYFTADFWYRNKFEIPATQEGKRTWLNFNSINWKADVYFNGQPLGKIEGSFIRGRFDISKLANYGGQNYLAVYIHANDNPGSVKLKTKDQAGPNGGVLGADNPTIHASIGWDWVPTIPGRNIGIYGDVFLNYTNDILIQDPFVITDLDVENKNFSKTDLTVKAVLSNPSNAPKNVVVTGKFKNPSGADMPELDFTSSSITLAAGEQKDVTVKQLTMQNPQLWWPNTYGDQPLYQVELTVIDLAKETVSDSKQINFGVRKFTYEDHNGAGPLEFYCNGAHIICHGGNWGMDDANLTATPTDYDVKIRMHAEANFTMIRNWVGMTHHRAFYDACDRYGILVWNDFWLANPGDHGGFPTPNDLPMFIKNAEDNIYRIRHHAALALYCGRNEGKPPYELTVAFERITQDQDGTRLYLNESADNVLTGEGYTYEAREPWFYFDEDHTNESDPSRKQSDKILQIERGFPNVPAYESLMKMLTEDHAWPMDNVWGMHDFCGRSAQLTDFYEEKIKNWYGTYKNLKEFARMAQIMNYEGMKAMYEGMYFKERNGLIMWMSQSAWPSMVWQTYDYYYDTNGGYFGCKKGNAPISAYWPNTQKSRKNEIILRNFTATDQTNLRVELNIYDINGDKIHSDSKILDIAANTSKTAMNIPALNTTNNIRFIKTEVFNSGGTLISDNFYWMNSKSSQNHKVLKNLPQVELEMNSTQISNAGNNSRYAVTISNNSNAPALLIRLKTLDEATGEQMLPVYYDDNYFSLMPGQSQTITLEIDSRYNTGTPKFAIEGWNILDDTPPANIIKTGNDNQIKLFPNPNNGLLYVYGISNFDVQIFDLAGTKVLQKTRQNDSVNISFLTAGVYLVNLTAKNISYSNKIVLSNEN